MSNKEEKCEHSRSRELERRKRHEESSSLCHPFQIKCCEDDSFTNIVISTI